MLLGLFALQIRKNTLQSCPCPLRRYLRISGDQRINRLVRMVYHIGKTLQCGLGESSYYFRMLAYHLVVGDDGLSVEFFPVILDHYGSHLRALRLEKRAYDVSDAYREICLPAKHRLEFLCS